MLTGRRVAGTLAAILLGWGLGGAAQAQVGPDARIVVLKPGANAGQVLARHGIAPDHVYSHALNGFAAVVPAARAQQLAADPDVAYIEADGIMTAFDQTLTTGINRCDADLSTTAKIDGLDERVDVDIAILDTGIDYLHPDLNVYTAGSKSFVKGARTASDDNGHGTHVAGIAAAIDNGAGVVGVAPGARLWAIKVLNSRGSGTTSTIIKGLDHVAANAAAIEVASLSLGGGFSQSLNDAVARTVAKGVVVVVAAGNSSVDAKSTSPASEKSAITVSAFGDSNGQPGGGGPSTSYGADDTFASFSNYGAVIDIAAPGVQILSTLPGGGYGVKSGTSMAAPHVTGAAALYVVKYGKPANTVGVDGVSNGLKAAGFAQNGPGGFTGGSFDGYAEPALNAGGF